MVWNYVQLVLLLLSICWLTFLIVAFCVTLYTNGTKAKVVDKLKAVVLMISVIIPDVYLIGLFFWRIFQMVS